jgi:hypothetical protein
MSRAYKKLLFPIHIFQTNIRENPIIQDELLPKIESLYQKRSSLIPDGWETDKLHTSFDLNSINGNLFAENSKATQYYIEYVSRFFDKPSKLEIIDIWYNYYVDGEYQEIHNHVSGNIFQKDSHFSCIHYLKFNSEIHLPTTFLDPLESLRHHSLEMESNHYGPKYHPGVREGDLIMFPSYLDHFVRKSQPTPNDPRITVAFNLHVLEYGEYGQHGS